MSDMDPDAKKAVEFLTWLTCGADMWIEHMSSEGQKRPLAKVFTSKQRKEAVDLIVSTNSEETRRNVYFLPNQEMSSGKRKLANLSGSRFLHVDLDYKDYPGETQEVEDHLLSVLMEKRAKGIPAPTAMWFTGGGIQAIWRLKEPISLELAEEMNRGLLGVFGGAGGTVDASRLLRLPWTTNWPDEKKRSAGREPATAWSFDPVRFNRPPASYDAEEIKVKRVKSKEVAVRGSGGSAPVDVIAPIPLPEDRSEVIPSEPKWVEVIVDGVDPPDKTYQSRSERVFAVVVWLLGRQVEPGHVVSIILEPDWKISEHVLENGNPLRYAQRQVARGQAVIAARGGNWPCTGNDGLPIPSHPENIRHALSSLGVSAQRNTFTNTDEFTGYGLDGRDLNDFADILVSEFIRELQFGATPASIKRELLAIAHSQTYHPVVDYLEGLQWDGVPRIDSWLADFTGAERTELNKEFGNKLLIAGVRRIRNPGVKFDTMLVLEGFQGTGKSRLAAALAVREEWFCGSLDLKSDDKTKAELLQRAWIVECQELDGLNKATGESLKRFLSTSVDSYRRAYARDAGEYRRHCIIIGTTNEDSYLRDLTGNRRIWPVQVRRIDVEGFKANVDQPWAEAAVREAKGESIVLSEHLWQAAQELQSSRMVEDPYADTLTAEFHELTGKVSLDSIKLLLGLDTSRMTPTDGRRVKAIMARLGWEYGTHRLHDIIGEHPKPRKGFARGSADERKVEHIAERLDGQVYTIIPFTPDDGEMPF